MQPQAWGTSAEQDALVSQRYTLDDINQGFPTGVPAATPQVAGWSPARHREPQVSVPLRMAVRCWTAPPRARMA